ncbi:MAG: serine hydrolase [Chitinophagaceae bacterium]
MHQIIKKEKMKSIFQLALFLTAIIYSSKVKSQSVNNIPKDSIDTYIKKTMNETGIVGIGAAIIINKKVVWENGYGYANKEYKIPFTTKTIMNIASISKTFTGACIMKAVEEGKISLDEDINTYLPFKVINPNFPNEKITLRNLATHTSSLIDRSPFYTDSTYYPNKDSPEPLGDFLKNYFVPGGKHYSQENFLKYKPGSYRDYSNIGAGLAGYIVEIATGKKLNLYSKQCIFEPLQMNNTGWFFSEINLANHSKLYDKKGDSIVPIPLYGTTTFPDGGIRTCVSELSKFFISLLNDGKFNGKRILKQKSVEEMTKFQYTIAYKPENVKLDKLNSGIFWATKLGGTRIGHNGSDPGVRTFMLSDLTKDIGIILFANTSLNENQENIYFDIYEELYKYAKTEKTEKTTSR